MLQDACASRSGAKTTHLLESLVHKRTQLLWCSLELSTCEGDITEAPSESRRCSLSAACAALNALNALRGSPHESSSHVRHTMPCHTTSDSTPGRMRSVDFGSSRKARQQLANGKLNGGFKTSGLEKKVT